VSGEEFSRVQAQAADSWFKASVYTVIADGLRAFRKVSYLRSFFGDAHALPRFS